MEIRHSRVRKLRCTWGLRLCLRLRLRGPARWLAGTCGLCGGRRSCVAQHACQVRLEHLVTTKRTLDLATLLSEDSTFFGDLFAHVVSWRGELYLEDGLHRALRAALQQRGLLHARVLELAG